MPVSVLSEKRVQTKIHDARDREDKRVRNYDEMDDENVPAFVSFLVESRAYVYGEIRHGDG